MNLMSPRYREQLKQEARDVLADSRQSSQTHSWATIALLALEELSSAPVEQPQIPSRTVPCSGQLEHEGEVVACSTPCNSFNESGELSYHLPLIHSGQMKNGARITWHDGVPLGC